MCVQSMEAGCNYVYPSVDNTNNYERLLPNRVKKETNWN